MKHKILLWLDDYRDPYINNENKVPSGFDQIIWVKNYSEFTDYILSNGLPDLISFDHDLAPEHYTPEEYWYDYNASKNYQEAQNYKEKTGADCADWLVRYCNKENLKIPNYTIHSANPVGSDNIKMKLNTV